MRIYIAGRYSTDSKGKQAGVMDVLKNIQRGTRISARLMSRGYNVYCPWLDHQFSFYEPEMDVKRYRENSMAWLEVSDCVVVISGRGFGGGVDAEIEKAKQLGIPVCDYDDALEIF